MTVSFTQLRRAGLTIALLGGLVAGALILSGPVRKLFARDPETTSQALTETIRTIVYRSRIGETTIFAFTRGVRQTRVVSYPVISEAEWQNGIGSYYGLRLVAIADDGSVAFDREVYFHAPHPVTTGETRRALDSKRQATGRLALTDEAIVATEVPFTTLEVTPIARDDGVEAIDLRAYQRRIYTNRTPATAFRRRSAESQARLAAANAFPADQLTTAEQTAVALNQWRPVGPVGIEGQDYNALVLYQDRKIIDRGLRQ